MVFEVYFLKTVLRSQVLVLVLFSDHCWRRTSGCLHGRALDMVICVALYQGLQIFAGRFGGKCLDQCKHCRPQRNPTGSKDHSRSPAPIITTRKPSESLSGWMSPLKRLMWIQVSKRIRIPPTPVSVLPQMWAVRCRVTLSGHWPSLGSGFPSLKRGDDL